MHSYSQGIKRVWWWARRFLLSYHNPRVHRYRKGRRTHRPHSYPAHLYQPLAQIAMPGKQVRFSRTSTLHSPPAPSPSYSLSSLPSSSGPITPPSLPGVLPGPSPYAFSLPPARPRSKSRVRPRVHALLALNRSPPVNYDLSLHPSTMSTHHISLSTITLAESAVHPPLPLLTLVSPHMPWSISVSASSNGAYVTVSDVYSAIYRSLRQNILPVEYHALPSDRDKRRVSAAYETRYRRLRGSRDYDHEKRAGVKRVDFLMGHTKFLGLTSTDSGNGVFVINVT